MAPSASSYGYRRNYLKKLEVQIVEMPGLAVSIDAGSRRSSGERTRRAVMQAGIDGRVSEVAVSSDACRNDASRNDGNHGEAVRPVTNHIAHLLLQLALAGPCSRTRQTLFTWPVR